MPDSTERPTSAARHYLSVFRRRRLPALLSVAVPVVLAIILSSSQQSAFQGTAQVLLSRQNLANALTNTPDPTSQANDFIRIVQTQADVARSPEVAQRAARLGHASLTPEEFLATSTVDPERDADLLTFHVVRHDQNEALRLTNAYARAFTEYRLSLDTSALRTAQQEVDSRLAELRLQGDTNSSLARSLVSKAQELGTLEALQTSNATVVSTARKAAQVAPSLKRNVFLGLVAGILLAVLVVAVLESLDTRVRDDREVERRLGLLPLARIGPPPPSLNGGLLTMSMPNEPEAEPFRLLRTSLQFSAAVGGQMRSLLVTSAVQKEGKSTTIANLAVTLARGGDRVILVDLDFRRPSLPRLFQLRPGRGFTDVLVGKVTLADALIDVPIAAEESGLAAAGDAAGSLKLLAAGSVPPNPGELATSKAVVDVIEQLKGQGDILLIDAPPALAFGDAMTLAAHVDAVFLCVRLPLVTISMLDDLHRALVSAHIRPIGCVVTGDLPHPDGGYGYGYAYGYVAEGTAENGSLLSRVRKTKVKVK